MVVKGIVYQFILIKHVFKIFFIILFCSNMDVKGIVYQFILLKYAC